MVVDGIVIAVLLISAIISFLRGFIRETLTILGVAGGMAAAYYGGPLLAPYIKNWLGVAEGEEPQRLFGVLPYTILGDMLSYGLIFIVVVIILSVISHFLAEGVKAIGLGAVDRTLGVIFGLARGLLLVSILYLPFHLILDQDTKNEWFKDSKTFVYLEGIASVLGDLLPESTVAQLKDTADKAGETPDFKEKLEKIDLLPGQTPPPADPNARPAPAGNTPGYDDEFRKKMNDMFQQGTTPAAPETPVPAAPAEPAPVEETPAAPAQEPAQ